MPELLDDGTLSTTDSEVDKIASYTNDESLFIQPFHHPFNYELSSGVEPPRSFNYELSSSVEPPHPFNHASSSSVEPPHPFNHASSSSVEPPHPFNHGLNQIEKIFDQFQFCYGEQCKALRIYRKIPIGNEYSDEEYLLFGRAPPPVININIFSHPFFNKTELADSSKPTFEIKYVDNTQSSEDSNENDVVELTPNEVKAINTIKESDYSKSPEVFALKDDTSREGILLETKKIPPSIDGKKIDLRTFTRPQRSTIYYNKDDLIGEQHSSNIEHHSPEREIIPPPPTQTKHLGGSLGLRERNKVRHLLYKLAGIVGPYYSGGVTFILPRHGRRPYRIQILPYRQGHHFNGHKGGQTFHDEIQIDKR